MRKGVRRENLNKRECLEILRVHRRIILKRILNIGDRGLSGGERMDWTNLAQHTNKRRVCFNTAMNLRGSYNAGN
jgi:hypothetical protein